MSAKKMSKRERERERGRTNENLLPRRVLLSDSCWVIPRELISERQIGRDPLPPPTPPRPSSLAPRQRICFQRRKVAARGWLARRYPARGYFKPSDIHRLELRASRDGQTTGESDIIDPPLVNMNIY